ncbi:MAG: hypothetical protein QM757_14400 [Paludibaculum sp.]
MFKPDNTLYDGQRIWLIDWEAAFLNDRFADLSVVANHVVTNDAEELIFLREYFGAEPTEYQRARFHLMRQLAHLFYTMAFLTLGSSGESGNASSALPSFPEFQRRMWAREVDLADNSVKFEYGLVHWQQLVDNVRQPRYREALKTISGRPVAPYGMA